MLYYHNSCFATSSWSSHGRGIKHQFEKKKISNKKGKKKRLAENCFSEDKEAEAVKEREGSSGGERTGMESIRKDFRNANGRELGNFDTVERLWFLNPSPDIIH